MSESNQSEFVPSTTGPTRPYWEATRGRRLVLQRCDGCGRLVHHPREACPSCLGQDFTWIDSHGHGTIHAMSVHHRPFEAMGTDDCPYVVAFIDLDDGVRFLSNIVDADPAVLRAGDPVDLTWRAIGDGYNLPVFRPGRR